MKKIIILALTLCALYACENAINQRSSITCEPNILKIGADGGESVVTIKSQKVWTGTTDQAWITLLPNSAQGDAFVTIKIDSGEIGDAHVLFSNGEGAAMLTIHRVDRDSGNVMAE